MSALSLHEIAALPFPASLNAIREHYDPTWGRPQSDEPRKFKVRVDYSISSSGTDTVTVEAENEDAAREAGIDAVADQHWSSDGDFAPECVKVVELFEGQDQPVGTPLLRLIETAQ